MMGRDASLQASPDGRRLIWGETKRERIGKNRANGDPTSKPREKGDHRGNKRTMLGATGRS